MENINLIRKIAWKFQKKTGLEFDELFQEAAYGYCLALEDWDEEKSNGCKLSSFAYRRMYFRLINFCKKETKRASKTSSMQNGLSKGRDKEDQNEPVPSHVLKELGLVFKHTEATEATEEIINEWPEDCQTAAKMVLNAPERFLGETPNFSREGPTPKQRVKDALRDKGWTCARVQQTINEMKTVIQSL